MVNYLSLPLIIIWKKPIFLKVQIINIKILYIIFLNGDY